jgi:hypothetical protein
MSSSTEMSRSTDLRTGASEQQSRSGPIGCLRWAPDRSTRVDCDDFSSDVDHFGTQKRAELVRYTDNTTFSPTNTKSDQLAQMSVYHSWLREEFKNGSIFFTARPPRTHEDRLLHARHTQKFSSTFTPLAAVLLGHLPSVKSSRSPARNRAFLQALASAEPLLAGSMTLNTEPPAAGLSYSMVPPWARAISIANASPSPWPGSRPCSAR